MSSHVEAKSWRDSRRQCADVLWEHLRRSLFVHSFPQQCVDRRVELSYGPGAILATLFLCHASGTFRHTRNTS